MKKVFFGTVLVVLIIVLLIWWLAQKPIPERIVYGMSFNTLYARELGLEWKEVYRAILDDLGVRHLRLAAHWDMVEPEDGVYNWAEIDYQVREASARKADIIFAVGRRLPRWPECHVPEWAKQKDWEDQKKEIREYLKAAINRYKDEPSIIYWQVENEPFLEVFAKEHCGEFDRAFLTEEITLVRELDPTRPILVTDSGNLGTWVGAYRAGDAFGTSVYVYFWNPELGPFKTLLPPWFYRVKEGLLAVMYGKKQTFLIELSAEPWLVESVTKVPLETQFTRMDPEKFSEIIKYAQETRYDRQYLWGAEWWYWLKKQKKPEMWDEAKELF